MNYNTENQKCNRSQSPSDWSGRSRRPPDETATHTGGAATQGNGRQRLRRQNCSPSFTNIFFRLFLGDMLTCTKIPQRPRHFNRKFRIRQFILDKSLPTPLCGGKNGGILVPIRGLPPGNRYFYRKFPNLATLPPIILDKSLPTLLCGGKNGGILVPIRGLLSQKPLFLSQISEFGNPTTNYP